MKPKEVHRAATGIDAHGHPPVAWELSIEESAASVAWSRAIADGLLERSGTDEVPGEETWRLTTWGRRADEGSC